MTLFNLFLIAVGLSMDAFAVSVCKGLAMEKAPLKKAAVAGLWFGSFQAIMPLIGYLLGSQFEKYITSIDHWIAFVLLSLIGSNMIRESFSKEEEETSGTMHFKEMFL
ncbi:MAG: manganese efflux pump, partial [Lachnospiraceae bacterium]|nr:manganese efflux pump [Lachnospiraceae bacterium]